MTTSHQARKIKTLILLPGYFDKKSNGLQAYMSLATSLASLEEVAFTSAQPDGINSSEEYNELCEGKYVSEKTLLESTERIKHIKNVVLPDHIDGLFCGIYDHLRCNGESDIKFINLVLAPLYIFHDPHVRPIETMYDDRDFFIYFNSKFCPSNYKVLDVYQEPTFDYLASMRYNEQAETISNLRYLSIYAGKGHFALDDKGAKKIREINEYFKSRDIYTTLITRSWPASKQDYIRLLQYSAGLILLDPFTNVVRDSLMIGTPVYSTTEGIDYTSNGITTTPDDFIALLESRDAIRNGAWDRHDRLTRLNLTKKALFIKAINSFINRSNSMMNAVFLGFDKKFMEASINFRSNYQKSCTVGELSHATHQIQDPEAALNVMMNNDSSPINDDYRAIASRYFNDN